MYQTVTLSVEKDVIRVAVFKGKKITSWGTAPLSWAPGELEAANHPDPENEKPPLHGLLEELGIRTGGRLRGLLDQAGIRRGRVVMDFSLYPTFPIWLKSFLSNSSMVFHHCLIMGPFCVFPAIITP